MRTTSKPSTRFGRAIIVLSGVAAWLLLILAGLLTALLLGWVVLGVLLLGSGPYAAGIPVPVILLALLALTGCLAWLTARYFASWRRVGQSTGLIVALVFFVGAIWALSAPNYALYYAREIAWGGTTLLTTPGQSPRVEPASITAKDSPSAPSTMPRPLSTSRRVPRRNCSRLSSTSRAAR